MLCLTWLFYYWIWSHSIPLETLRTGSPISVYFYLITWQIHPNFILICRQKKKKKNFYNDLTYSKGLNPYYFLTWKYFHWSIFVYFSDIKRKPQDFMYKLIWSLYNNSFISVSFYKLPTDFLMLVLSGLQLFLCFLFLPLLEYWYLTYLAMSKAFCISPVPSYSVPLFVTPGSMLWFFSLLKNVCNIYQHVIICYVHLYSSDYLFQISIKFLS